MRNLFLALLRELAGNSLKNSHCRFYRTNFNKTFCPWTAAICHVPGHLILIAKAKRVRLESKQTNSLHAKRQMQTGAAEMDFHLVKHNVNLCFWSSSLKTSCSWALQQGGLVNRSVGARLLLAFDAFANSSAMSLCCCLQACSWFGKHGQLQGELA